MAWIENGPVALPSRGLMVWAGLAILIAAGAGVGLGVRASWRDTSRAASGGIDQAQDSQAIIAKPIVELPAAPPPPPVTNAVAANSAAKEAAVDDSDIAAKTAAAQAVQSKPSQQNANIDDILTSSSEKPQAPAKPSTDEDAPGGPAKTDVPF
jgi:hypothetical protein